ncbi:hypothetical protein DFH27DRAFT_629823 [Peziza echinospora]|nr:hypothetical protein DFH27DRAFT_629823 [Peziza echinospora]
MPKAFTPTDISASQPHLFSRTDRDAGEYTPWLPSLERSCVFPEEIFLKTMDDMILNPNINSSLLLRADVLWDDSTSTGAPSSDITPLKIQVRGYTQYRSLVRKFVPRNPELDKSLLQSCLFFREDEVDGDGDGEGEGSLVIYLPHANGVEEIPFYHPPVQGVAFLHRHRGVAGHGGCPCCSEGAKDEPVQAEEYMLSIHHLLFPARTEPAIEIETTTTTETTPTAASKEPELQTQPQPPRLARTLHHLLHKLHKNSTGTHAGYVKRVNHDVVLGKELFQDIYLYLKGRHARRLMEGWVESTDPRKHVFEDLGIAAFLLGIWRERYYLEGDDTENTPLSTTTPTETPAATLTSTIAKSLKKRSTANTKSPWAGPKRKWAGFVDIGCGNGVLVDILRREGYEGYGIDARRRKTWDVLLNSPTSPVFPSASSTTASRWLRQEILVPSTLLPTTTTATLPWESTEFGFTDGIYPPNTFLISNHSDQLTGWTPLLATLSDSPFLAIPCCAYTLSADKFRPGSDVSWVREILRSAQQNSSNPGGEGGKGIAGSTYSGLVAWAEGLAGKCGWKVEKEVLRIPSTRNVGLLGWEFEGACCAESGAEREERVRGVLREEGGGGGWTEKVVALVGAKKEGH